MDKSPFMFGKLASGSTFINRQEDIKKLSSNFSSGINTILVSPRRWGKSSLVEKVSETISRDGKTRVCIIDMFNTRSEDAFYQLFSKQLIKSTSNQWEEWVKTAKDEFVSNPRLVAITGPVEFENRSWFFNNIWLRRMVF